MNVGRRTRASRYLVGALVMSVVAGCTATSGSTPTSSSTATATASPAGKDLPIIAPVTTCAELTKQDLTGLPDAATTITSATEVAVSTTNTYAYCDVKGKVSTQIQFEMLMPTTTYRQRYLQEGCEGLCGQVSVSTQPAVSTGCAPVTDGSFVIGEDNEGHTAAGLGGTTEQWAADPQLRIDFGYRSEHAFATAAKAVTKAFYGAPPAYAYYDGCSDGGREALMEAQRYPTDFNGILAGAPAFNQTALNGFEEAYLATIDFRTDGSTILPASKISMLHAAVIKACADPGLDDQTIQDPRQCTFNPATLACPTTTDAATCLTADQVGVVRKAYAGAVAPDGTHLYTGGEPYGSELKWEGLLIPQDGQNQTSIQLYGIGLSFLRWLNGTQPSPDLTLNASLFTVANLNASQQAVSGIYDSTNPDLTPFAQAGGKLIQYHGWADQNIPPVGTIAYRQAVIDTMGSAAVDKFYRLYMFPGMYHCGGGEGPAVFDLLSPLLNWTENGTAPGAVTATKTTSNGEGGGGASSGQLTGSSGGTGGFAGPSGGGTAASGSNTATSPTALPSASNTASATTSAAAATTSASASDAKQYTRPVYPYPQRVTYTGSGDVNSAANYTPSTPAPIDDHYHWAGSFTH